MTYNRNAGTFVACLVKLCTAASALALLSACSSTMPQEEFLQLSPQAQAQVVCTESDAAERRVAEMQKMERTAYEQQALLDKGYRTHRSCRNVKQKTSESKQDCGGATGIELQTCNIANSFGGVSYSTQECVETPIPIDYDYERNVLNRLETSVGLAQAAHKQNTEACLMRAYGASAKTQYMYHEAGQEP